MSDYYEDEYYEEPEPEYMGGGTSVVKAANGQLYIEEVTAWSDGVHYDMYFWEWSTQRYSIKGLQPAIREIAVRVGKYLEPGQSVDITDWWQYNIPDDDDDWIRDLVEVDETYCMIEGEKQEGFSTHSDDVSDLPF